jgi:tRNA pseudouridine13 synthase
VKAVYPFPTAASGREKLKGGVGSDPEDFQVFEIHLSGTKAGSGSFEHGLSGRYTLGVLRKRNISTINAIRRLARHYGTEASMIGYGGLKDTYAVTWQFLTIPGRVDRYSDYDMEFTPHGMRLMPFGPREILGNAFRIVVYGFEDGEHLISSFLEACRSPTPAFFGEQRFGGVDMDTHTIGLLLLKRDYAGAIRRILQGKGVWYEELIRQKLSTGSDERAAIMSLPGYLTRLFINSYQASVFNRTLTALIERGKDLSEIGTGYVAVRDVYGLPARIIPCAQGGRRQGGKLIPVARLVGSEWHNTGSEFDSVQASVMQGDGIFVKDFADTSCGDIRGSFRPLYFLARNASANVSENRAVLEFELPRGMYATVLLRELLTTNRGKSP